MFNWLFGPFPTKSERDCFRDLLSRALMDNPDLLKRYKSIMDIDPTNGLTLEGWGGTQIDLEQQLKLMREVVELTDYYINKQEAG